MHFKKGLFISFGIHILVIIFMTLQVIFFAPKMIDISQAVRVDMVNLSDKDMKNELPEKEQEILKEKTRPAEKPKPEPKPEDQIVKHDKQKELPQKKVIEPDHAAVNLDKAKLKQKNAVDKLKKLSALEKIKQDVKSSDESKENKKTIPIKARILSAGTKIAGLDKLQSDEYLSLLDAQIKANWSMPEWMIGKPFKASVWVKLDPTGQVIFKKISRPSGNPTFDEYCLAAIEKASPFPRVPEKFGEVYKTDGVSFAFPD